MRACNLVRLPRGCRFTISGNEKGSGVMNKIFPSAEAALEGTLKDGKTLVAGGFGLCGVPERLIDAIVASGVKNLTIASNNAGKDGEGLGKLLSQRPISKMISTYGGRNQELESKNMSRKEEEQLE